MLIVVAPLRATQPNTTRLAIFFNSQAVHIILEKIKKNCGFNEVQECRKLIENLMLREWTMVPQ